MSEIIFSNFGQMFNKLTNVQNFAAKNKPSFHQYVYWIGC